MVWEEKYFVRVCCILGELATHDNGEGNYGNRPINSLCSILLPWYPQTLAPPEKRIVAIKTLREENPKIAWDLILRFLPLRHKAISMDNSKPKWRKTLPKDFEIQVSNKEYWEQVSAYSEIAVSMASEENEKLIELIGYFDRLPTPSFDELLTHLSSDTVINLPETERTKIWDKLKEFTNHHRKFPDAKWSLDDKILLKIEKATNVLTPVDPFYKHQYLFSKGEREFYKRGSDWRIEQKKIEEKRQKAIEEILSTHGIESVVEFSKAVQFPNIVGSLLGNIANSEIDQLLLPSHLSSPNKNLTDLMTGYIWNRFEHEGESWIESFDFKSWKTDEKKELLLRLPFSNSTWKRVPKMLRNKESEYWKKVSCRWFFEGENYEIAIEKLLKYGRPLAVLEYFDYLILDKQEVNIKQCVSALMMACRTSESPNSISSYSLVEIVQYLQEHPKIDPNDIFSIEWAYLPLLDRNEGLAPIHLEKWISKDPTFFCELIQLAFRSKHETNPPHPKSPNTEHLAGNAWRLLHNCRTVPALQEDGSINEDELTQWVASVKEECKKSGHFEIAFQTIGNFFYYSPRGNDSLWIARCVAKILNDRDSEEMRKGFSLACYNSRGVYTVDPTGNAERNLAEKYRAMAEEVENANYNRLASTMREISESYERDAERVIQQEKEFQQKFLE